MSKKTKWIWVGSNEPNDLRNFVTDEEKTAHNAQKTKERRKLFKLGLALDKMPTNKPHFGKKVKLATEDRE